MTDPEVMASRSPRFNMGLCETCKTVRPLRSKHCNHCGRCATLKLLAPSLSMGASFFSCGSAASNMLTGSRAAPSQQVCGGLRPPLPGGFGLETCMDAFVYYCGGFGCRRVEAH